MVVPHNRTLVRIIDPRGHVVSTTAVAPALAPGTYTADTAHSSFGFGVRHMGVSTFRASFEEVEASLTVDADGTASVRGVAQAESITIKAPQPFRDHVVYGADFFDANRTPTLAFESERVELAEDGTARVEGTLTVRDNTAAVVAAGTWSPAIEDPFGGVRTSLELTARVDRRELGLEYQTPLPKGGDALGWDVDLAVHLELVRTEA